MRCLINLVNQTPEIFKEYTVDNIKPTFETHNNHLCVFKIRLSVEDFNKYITENKIYYYHEFVNASLFKSRCCIFVYNEETHLYHVASFYKSSSFDNIYGVNIDPNNKNYYILEDITSKMSNNLNYYKKYYCLPPTNNFIFYTDEKECQLASCNYDIMNAQKELNKIEAKKFKIENDYESEFNSRLETSLEELKKQIKIDIENDISNIDTRIYNLNLMIHNWNAEKRNINKQ